MTPASGHDRWVINKLRALNGWYSKGLDGGAMFRTAVNHVESIGALQSLIVGFFLETGDGERWAHSSTIEATAAASTTS